MRSPPDRRQKLLRLMREHALTCPAVGILVHRTPDYVTMWRTGRYEMPECLLRLLELELEHGHGRELVQSRAAG